MKKKNIGELKVGDKFLDGCGPSQYRVIQTGEFEGCAYVVVQCVSGLLTIFTDPHPVEVVPITLGDLAIGDTFQIPGEPVRAKVIDIGQHGIVWDYLGRRGGTVGQYYSKSTKEVLKCG